YKMPDDFAGTGIAQLKTVLSKVRGAWYETGAVSPDSPSSPAHNAPDDRQYSKRRGLAPAAPSLGPCFFGVPGLISFFGGASTAPAIRGCRACTREGSRTGPGAIGAEKRAGDGPVEPRLQNSACGA